MTKRAAYHHGDLARALIESAIAIIGEAGVEGLTLNAAAKRAGVSHAAVYRHYEDKHALLVGIAESGFEKLGATFGAAIASKPKDARAAFLHLGRSVVRFAVLHPVLFRVMFSKANPLSVADLAAAPKSSAFGMLLDEVRSFQRAGLLRKGDPLDHAIAMWSATHGVASLAINGVLPSSTKAVTRLADAVHEALLDGIARPR